MEGLYIPTIASVSGLILGGMMVWLLMKSQLNSSSKLFKKQKCSFKQKSDLPQGLD